MASRLWVVLACALGIILVLLGILGTSAPDPQSWDKIAVSGEQPPLTADGIPETTPLVSAEVSAVIAHGLVNALMPGMFFTALALAAFHRRRARAQQAFDPRAPLRDGAVMLFGAVESLRDHEGPVVEIRIEQLGTEKTHKGVTSHVWKETGREVRVSPFVVVCHDGTRVRVEPDEQVVLEGGLVVVAGDRHDARGRYAALRAGDEVHINGELQGASMSSAREDVYRGSSAGPVLRPPRSGRMVISTEGPGEVARSFARLHARSAAAIALVFAVVAGLLIPSYELLAFDGEVVMAQVDGSRTWQKWVKPKNQPSRLVTYYGVHARLQTRDGSFMAVEADCNAAIYQCVQRGICTHVPFLVSTHMPSAYQLGTRPLLTESRVCGVIAVALLLSFAYIRSILELRPWYVKKKLDESGDGTLSQSMT